MIYRLFKLYNVYQTGKKLYTKVLKPVYEELRKDAYANDTEPKTKRRKQNVKHQKPKRSNKPKADTKGL
jgi:hypothetical protein